jgi:hypothetical protein
MPIQRGVFVSSRSLDLFSPGKRHPRIKGCVHACHALKPAAPYGEREAGAGWSLVPRSSTVAGFCFYTKYWPVQADSTLELGRCAATPARLTARRGTMSVSPRARLLSVSGAGSPGDDGIGRYRHPAALGIFGTASAMDGE